MCKLTLFIKSINVKKILISIELSHHVRTLIDIQNSNPEKESYYRKRRDDYNRFPSISFIDNGTKTRTRGREMKFKMDTRKQHVAHTCRRSPTYVRGNLSSKRINFQNGFTAADDDNREKILKITEAYLYEHLQAKGSHY